MNPINVAITIDLRADPTQSIWYNGANQNCVFLYMALKRIPYVRNVWLTGNLEGHEVSNLMMLDKYSDEILQRRNVDSANLEHMSLRPW